MYQPNIQNDLIKKMYWRGQEESKPMTVVVDEILRESLSSNGGEKDEKDSV